MKKLYLLLLPLIISRVAFAAAQPDDLEVTIVRIDCSSAYEQDALGQAVGPELQVGDILKHGRTYACESPADGRGSISVKAQTSAQVDDEYYIAGTAHSLNLYQYIDPNTHKPGHIDAPDQYGNDCGHTGGTCVNLYNGNLASFTCPNSQISCGTADSIKVEPYHGLSAPDDSEGAWLATLIRQSIDNKIDPLTVKAVIKFNFINAF